MKITRIDYDTQLVPDFDGANHTLLFDSLPTVPDVTGFLRLFVALLRDTHTKYSVLLSWYDNHSIPIQIHLNFFLIITQQVQQRNYTSRQPSAYLSQLSLSIQKLLSSQLEHHRQPLPRQPETVTTLKLSH